MMIMMNSCLFNAAGFDDQSASERVLGTSFHHRCQVEIIFITIFSASGAGFIMEVACHACQGCQPQVSDFFFLSYYTNFYICSALYMFYFMF